ncbi:hypothetical protein NOI20_14730 [Rhodobacteraceae bacterium 10Alg 79]|uniref:Lipoprotein n=2 Tax=Rhodalgimonas zhirmunskyi TaxID=2964767 RepID=A0AAJ1U8N4_9RHOB|nr:hypothetical protein [Rhodoalgimonas zhirmunskyi]MDQ2095371.1 hypothetical protein [Rhodoalgimonas zhirmunskyi]
MKHALRITPTMLAGALAALVTGCDVAEEPGAVTRLAPPPADLEFRGVETRLLGDDLVQFVVRTGPGAERAHVARYAECAAAQYALIRGYGFARHVRTSIAQDGNDWQGDAVYTISASLPDGLKTIDAEVVVNTCAEDGIPTV